MTYGKNPMVLDRQHNMGMLRDMLTNVNKPHKQILAEFAVKTGLTRKRVNDYYESLVEAGQVKLEEVDLDEP